jgi:hypothetical protein
VSGDEKVGTRLAAFRWNRHREEAARLVAEDLLSNELIAARFGVSRQSLDKWKRHPEFQARVSAIRDATRAAIIAEGIANQQNRVNALNDRWQRMQRVIEERAADDISGTFLDDETGEAHVVAGWRTGLLVRAEKPHGIEFAVDVGLLRELRAHEEQAAKELGQWVDRNELSGADGKPFTFTIQIDRRDDAGDDGDSDST